MISGISTKTIPKYTIGANLFFIDNSASFLAQNNGICLNGLIGYIRIIAEILNKRWLKATTIAIGLSTKAAIIDVIVVPILAPSVKGKICLNDKTPAPANGTIVEVVIEELWTITVKIKPKIKALIAVLKIYWSN